MNRWLQVFLVLNLFCWCLPTVQSASYPRVNVNLAIRYIVPNYQNFTDEAANQLTVFERFCNAPSENTFAAAQTAFHTALDAWMLIQHIDFGPIEQAFQAQRINYWPGRRNAVTKSLNALLKRQDHAALKPVKFAQLSVAAQGFPALEYLLFSDAALASFISDDTAARFRCSFLLAIGRNLNDIARNLSQEWQSKVLPALGAGGSVYFPKPVQATRRMMTSLRNLLQVVADLKLERVLGESVKQAKPRLAENRRSERSVRNILLNLQSARAMYGEADDIIGFNTFVLQAENGPVLNTELQQAFADAIAAVQAIQGSLETAVTDPERRVQVEAALTKTEVLRNLFRDIVPRAADINLGFTSFGD